MFASQVASYNDQPLLATASTTALENFDIQHPLYRQVQALAALRKTFPALRRGKQITRQQSLEPGLFAVSRFGSDGREVVIAFNTSSQPVTAQVEVDPGSRAFTSVHGTCAAPGAPGSLKVELAPFAYLVCAEVMP
jgi:hypothetical protein